jgi:hypothetical protein
MRRFLAAHEMNNVPFPLTVSRCSSNEQRLIPTDGFSLLTASFGNLITLSTRPHFSQNGMCSELQNMQTLDFQLCRDFLKKVQQKKEEQRTTIEHEIHQIGDDLKLLESEIAGELLSSAAKRPRLAMVESLSEGVGAADHSISVAARSITVAH